MAATIVSNSTAATFGNSPQKTGEPLDHAKLYSGKALEFDGVADWLTIPDWNIPASNSFTLAAWVYRHSNPSSNYVSSILSNSYAHLGFFTSGKVYWRIRGPLATWVLDANDNIATSVAVPLNTWTRIVAVHTYERDQRIYINGALDSVYKEYTGSLLSGGTYGKYNALGKAASSPNSFDGKICDVQIWENIAWSSTDVEYDYENPETLATGRSGTSLATSNAPFI